MAKEKIELTRVWCDLDCEHSTDDYCTKEVIHIHVDDGFVYCDEFMEIDE